MSNKDFSLENHLNHIELVGRVVSCDAKTLKNGKNTKTTIKLVVNGDGQLKRTYFTVLFWDNASRKAYSHLAVGDLLYIKGRIHSRKWETENKVMYLWEISATEAIRISESSSINIFTEESVGSDVIDQLYVRFNVFPPTPTEGKPVEVFGVDINKGEEDMLDDNIPF